MIRDSLGPCACRRWFEFTMQGDAGKEQMHWGRIAKACTRVNGRVFHFCILIFLLDKPEGKESLLTNVPRLASLIDQQGQREAGVANN